MSRRTEELDGPTVGLPRQTFRRVLFNVPVQTPTRGPNRSSSGFLLLIGETAPVQASFMMRIGVRRTYSRLKPPRVPTGTRFLIYDDIWKAQNKKTHEFPLWDLHVF